MTIASGTFICFFITFISIISILLHKINRITLQQMEKLEQLELSKLNKMFQGDLCFPINDIKTNEIPEDSLIQESAYIWETFYKDDDITLELCLGPKEDNEINIVTKKKTKVKVRKRGV